jgi:hypothetical protein
VPPKKYYLNVKVFLFTTIYFNYIKKLTDDIIRDVVDFLVSIHPPETWFRLKHKNNFN